MADDKGFLRPLLDSSVESGVSLVLDAVVAFLTGWAGRLKLESIPDPWPWFLCGVSGVLVALTIRPATAKGRTLSFRIATGVLIVSLLTHGIYQDADTSTPLLAVLDLFVAIAMFGSAVHVLGGIREQYRLWRDGNTQGVNKGP